MTDKTIEEIIVRDYRAAGEEGRRDDQLRMLQDAVRQAEAGTPMPGMSEFIAMFEWGLLVEDYPPARTAMAALRDDYTRRLLAGDDNFPSPNSYLRPSRFKIIAEMNQALGEEAATHALFAELDAYMPDVARRSALFALPAVVDGGGYTLAERYLDDPLRHLEHVNASAADLPLFPAPHEAPRLASDVLILINGVRMRAAVLDGLGRAVEAQTLREAALAGIASDEVRALAQRELAEPGTITRIIVERQMAADGAATP